jgi:hypothetical protein
LFEEVIRCADIYQSEAKPALQNMQEPISPEQLKQMKETPWTLKLTKDDMTHENHVTAFIDFIEFLIINSKSYTLSFDNLSSLF